MNEPLSDTDQMAAVVRAYDAAAEAYLEANRAELDHKPVDRALLDEVCSSSTGGALADLGCGPGHISRYLTHRHDDVVGIDISPRMIALARHHAPAARFVIGTLLSLPVPAETWSGAVTLYSLIHLSPPDRTRALAEIARVLRPGGVLLAAVHVRSDTVPRGGRTRVQQFLGREADMDGYFIDPVDLIRDLERAGFEITLTLTRAPVPGVEFPSQRAYVLGRRLP